MEYSGNKKILVELDKVIIRLSNNEKLSERNFVHKLKGEFQGCFECHVLPDWLLIYKIYEDVLVLELISTGSHSELFD